MPQQLVPESPSLSEAQLCARKGRQSCLLQKMADTMLQTLPAVTLPSLRDLG